MSSSWLFKDNAKNQRKKPKPAREKSGAQTSMLNFAFQTKDARVHSYTIASDTTLVFKKMRLDVDNPWMDKVDRQQPQKIRVFKCKFNLSSEKRRYIHTARPSEIIYFTVTLPDCGKAKGFLIHSKANTWDLGTFHRPFRSRPYDMSLSTVTQSYAKIIANSTKHVVVCYEYPGYGIESVDQRDIVQAPMFAAEMVICVHETVRRNHIEYGIMDARCSQWPIIMHGFSVGCAIIVKALCYLKLLHEKGAYAAVKGVILQSAFASMADTSPENELEWAFQEGFKSPEANVYSTKDFIHLLYPMPISFVHGVYDLVCPAQKSYLMLYAHYHQSSSSVVAPTKFYMILNGNHNNLPLTQKYHVAMKDAVRWMTKSVKHRFATIAQAYKNVPKDAIEGMPFDVNAASFNKSFLDWVIAKDRVNLDAQMNDFM